MNISRHNNFLRKFIIDYVRDKYGYENNSTDEINKVRDLYCKLLLSMSENILVNTKYGKYYVNLSYLNIDSYKNRTDLFLDYIFSKVEYNESVNVRDILSNNDIGLVVCQHQYDETSEPVNRVFFNVDEDIADWIFDKDPNVLLLSMAQGDGSYYIDSGLCIKFMQLYMDLFDSYEPIRALTGFERSLYDYVYNEVKDYEHNGKSFFRSDIMSEYSQLYLDNKCDFGDGPLFVGDTLINYGLNDSKIREIIKRNDMSLCDRMSDVSDIITNVRKGMKIDYNKDFLSKDDIDKAIYEVRYINNLKYDNCRRIREVCAFFNINQNSLIGKLLSDMDITSAVVSCVAERNKYKQGYFYYKYNNLDEVNFNEFSTKAFMRKMIEMRK